MAPITGIRKIDTAMSKARFAAQKAGDPPMATSEGSADSIRPGSPPATLLAATLTVAPRSQSVTIIQRIHTAASPTL